MKHNFTLLCIRMAQPDSNRSLSINDKIPSIILRSHIRRHDGMVFVNKLFEIPNSREQKIWEKSSISSSNSRISSSKFWVSSNILQYAYFTIYVMSSMCLFYHLCNEFQCAYFTIMNQKDNVKHHRWQYCTNYTILHYIK